MKHPAIVGLISAAAVSFGGYLYGHGGHQHQPVDEVANSKNEIIAILRLVAVGWEQGDGKVFRQYYDTDPGLRVVESGRQNAGLDDLVDNHVIPEHAEHESMQVIVSTAEIHVSPDLQNAWSISDVELKGRIKKGEEFQAKGYETTIWRKKDRIWKIIHSHASYKKIK